MSQTKRSPAQLRSMFGANLRQLAEGYRSISALARELRINRTQFNRYLSGESFPRPDVLARICEFFEVDARVLLEPVDQISRPTGVLGNGYLSEFMGEAVQHVPESEFPSGFYTFSRRSFVKEDEFARGLVLVKRIDGATVVRGYEPKVALAMQGIPPAPIAREYRGYVQKVEEGVTLVASRRNGLTGSINFLHRVSSFQNNYWVGYVARTVRENASSTRITRLVYEYLDHDMARVMKSARRAGFCALEDLAPFHQRLLQPGDTFR